MRGGDIEAIARLAIDDLAPLRSLTAMHLTDITRETERTAQLATLAPAEIKAFRFRLETALTEAQRMFSLAPPECGKTRGRLPPVQPSP